MNRTLREVAGRLTSGCLQRPSVTGSVVQEIRSPEGRFMVLEHFLIKEVMGL